MAGFSKKRFVNLTNVEEELTCGICLEILNEPVVVQCCRQTYCKKCIKEWMDERQTCPNDRRVLGSKSLVEPPRLIQNMISRLKICCDYAENGCKNVLVLDNLSSHLLECKFKPKNLCKDCGIPIDNGKDHDCLLNLKALNSNLVDETSRLKTQIKQLLARISSERNKDNQAKDVLISAREWIETKNEPKIRLRMGSENVFLNKIIDISRDAIKTCDTYGDISKQICHKIREVEINKGWHVIVYSRECGESLVSQETNYLDMYFGEMRIEIFSAGNRQ